MKEISDETIEAIKQESPSIHHFCDVIQFADAYQSDLHIQSLFKPFFIVRDFDEAFRLYQKYGYPYHFLTCDGDYIEGRGIAYSGNDESESVISRNRLLDEFRLHCDDLKQNIITITANRDEKQNEIAELESVRTAYFGEKKEVEANHKLVSDDLIRVDHKLDVVSDKLVESELKKQNLLSLQDGVSKNIESKLQDIIGEVTYYVDGQSTYDQVAVTKQSMESELKLIQDDIRRFEIEHAASNERFQNLMDAITADERSKEFYVTKKNQLEAEKLAHDSQKGDTERNLELLTVEIEQMHQDAETKYVKLVNLKESLLNAISDYEKIGSDLEETKRLLSDQTEKLSAISHQSQQLDMQIQNEHTLIMDKYASSLDSTVLPDDFSIMKAKSSRNELKEKITGYGDVNLASIDEFHAVSERHQFLTNQKEDLVTSLSSLEKAITEIEQNTKHIFLDAFTKINENFSETFKELFNGGEARLVMDESHPLESGVDIEARPPGKKIQKITLLSGGEKALTTFALLVAIFKFKTSPFCFLDEVDAPLDDANINRFCDMIRKMSQNVQFITVTHNKKTMEIADTMYGITMQEKGVSKVVSVKFSEDQQSKPYVQHA